MVWFALFGTIFGSIDHGLPVTHFKDKTNRWANIILGIVYAVVALIVLVEPLAKLSALTILPASGAVFTALIVWYAYKWSKG